MSPDILSISSKAKTLASKAKQDGPMLSVELNFRGINEDIIESYYWHLNFAYFVGKGWKAIKLEDYHHFSENSQFGQNMRQIKGGSIRAFQENLQQMIQLIKVHMMPLLKEVKQAEFYKTWIDQIVDNDKKVQELKKKGVSDDNQELQSARRARNEAINHIKDKWVNEVDGGRMWQMNRSSTEQGLDYALLPQLFFGISLDDPLNVDTITKQLDKDVYPVDISENAKEQVARFMYRFHTWLPTAIRETQTTFRIKIASLKQFYTQLQMYANFMKPLLLEIHRKNEGHDYGNFYKNFAENDPEIVTLFDYSYSFIKLCCVKGFEREGFSIDDLEINDKGLFIKARSGKFSSILAGKFKGKEGYITGEKTVKDSNGDDAKGYSFVPCSKNVSNEEFKKLKEKHKDSFVFKKDFRTFPIMVLDFLQKRKTTVVQTQQGPQPAPHMNNQIKYNAHVWNQFEIATYREKLKDESLDLLANFIEEVGVIKDDLLKYIGMLNEGESDEEKKDSSNSQSQSAPSSDYTLVVGPIQGLGALFSPLIPSFGKKQSENREKEEADDTKKSHHELNYIDCIEDTWKVYNVHKKTKQFYSY